MHRYRLLLVTIFLSWTIHAACAEVDKPLYFGVINQRSVSLTAQTWNPILAYVSKKTGIPLVLKIGKTAPETTEMTARGEHAFAYTNHMFTPERNRIGYHAILRMQGDPIHSVIVVRIDSPMRKIENLVNAKVAFPSHEAFLGYWVPMDHLLKSGIQVKQIFAGNQEGAIAQLQHGQVAAAAVNSKILIKYARREDFQYHVIWTSEPFLDIPVMAHPDIPSKVVETIRQAFLGMSQDPEGIQALQDSAATVEQNSPWSFMSVNDKDYDNYRNFYQSTVIRGN